MNNVKEFEIDLTSSNDCNFILDVLKNSFAIGEMYSSYYDGADHMTCVIYVNDETFGELCNNFPIFEDLVYDEYELDEESANTLTESKKTLIDDIYELKNIYFKFEELCNKYSVE